ncbi:hypothetical protein ACLIJJ_25135 [Niallia sp. BSM11]
MPKEKRNIESYKKSELTEISPVYSPAYPDSVFIVGDQGIIGIAYWDDNSELFIFKYFKSAK